MIKFLEIINEHYKLEEKVVEPEFAKFKMSGMNFTVKRYIANDFATVSHMSCEGMFGAMKMDTIVICPIEKEANMVSYDRIHAMGKDTLVFERYEGIELLEHTEEKGGSKDSERIDALVYGKLEDYLKAVDKQGKCDAQKQAEKIANYREWLAENGGVATDNFIKNIGKEKTKEFFTKVLFSNKMC